MFELEHGLSYPLVSLGGPCLIVNLIHRSEGKQESNILVYIQFIPLSTAYKIAMKKKDSEPTSKAAAIYIDVAQEQYLSSRHSVG